MPRVPSAENVDFLRLFASGLFFLGQQRGQVVDALLETRFTVHRQMDDKVQASSDYKRFLNSASILCNALAAAGLEGVIPRARDNETSYATEVGIIDLEV